MSRRLSRALSAASLLLTIAAASAAQAAEKITISALTFVSSSPLFIAQDKGYYAEEGLEVEFKFFRAAQPVAPQVQGGCGARVADGAGPRRDIGMVQGADHGVARR